MKQMLSLKRSALTLLAACSLYGANAQITINTPYTNTLQKFPATSQVNGGSVYATFTVRNNNPYPVVISDIAMYHDALETYNFGGNPTQVSTNGATYVLIRDNNTASAYPNLPAAVPGGSPATWPTVAFSSPIYATTNGIIPVITGVKTSNLSRINANTSVRFGVVVNDTMPVIVGPNNPAAPPNFLSPFPYSFTSNGIDLFTTMYNSVYTGIYNNSIFTGGGWFTDSTAFLGSVTVRRAGPAISISGVPTCQGGSIILNATIPGDATGATVTWYGPNGYTAVGNNITRPNVQPADSGLYYATFTFAGQTTAQSEPALAQIFSTPKAPVIAAKVNYCINEPWEQPVVTGQNILWYLSATGGTGSTIQPYVNTTVAGIYTWYASQTINGCESPRTQLTIQVAPVPPAPLVTTPISYCENADPVALSAGGQNLKWYIQPFLGLGSVNPPTPNTSAQDTNTWYVSQTIDGCEGPRSRIDVITTFKPNGIIVPVRKPEICQHDTLSFIYYGSGTPSTAYNWTVPFGATPVSGGGAGPFTIVFDSAGTKQVTMQAGNLTCYSDLFIQNVIVNPIPTAIIAAKQEVCQHEQQFISLYSYTPTTDTFYWDFDGGQTSHFATDQGPYGVSWNTPGEKVITLTLADKICRSLPVRDTITVRAVPDAAIVGYTLGEKICSGDSLKLEPRSLVTTSTYTWSPTRFFEEYNNQPVAYARIDFATQVKLKVQDAFGCVNEDSIAVNAEPCCDILFPTAFTPNNDGLNDLFRAVASKSKGGQNVQTFRVHNRWGQNVYESRDENAGWDGNFNGKPLDMGVYYYFIKYKCNGKDAEQRGEVTLIR